MFRPVCAAISASKTLVYVGPEVPPWFLIFGVAWVDRWEAEFPGTIKVLISKSEEVEEGQTVYTI
jgi:hypothetical protein